jgi:hypothetical protein
LQRCSTVFTQPVVERQLVGTADLGLQRPPGVREEEGAGEEGERKEGPVDRPTPGRRQQPSRLRIGDQQQEQRRIADDDPRDERDVRTEVDDKREGQELEQQWSSEWAPGEAEEDHRDRFVNARGEREGPALDLWMRGLCPRPDERR